MAHQSRFLTGLTTNSGSRFGPTGKITWLASFPKSGNTWVRLLVSAYLTGGDTINWLPFATSQNDIKFQDYQSVAAAPLTVLDPLSVVALRPAVLDRYRFQNWHLMKTHNARVRVNGVDLIPPYITDRAVYLIRDPRDVVPSYAAHVEESLEHALEFCTNDRACMYDDFAPSLAHYTSDWSTNVWSWTEKDDKIDTLVVRYEDLVEDTEGKLTEILEYLGFNVDGDRVRHAVEVMQFDRCQEIEKREGFMDGARIPFFSRRKPELTDEARKTIEEVHGEMMEKWGYGD